MSKAFTGGCACGAVSYEIQGEPILMTDCQCRQCQRESGTGHGSHLVFQHATVKVHGEAAFWQNTGDLGTVKNNAFCGACGSPVYTTFPHMPDFFGVRAGSLDEPGRYHPQMVLWTAAGHPWDHHDSALQKFDKMQPR